MIETKTGKQLILLATFMSFASLGLAAILAVSLDGSQSFTTIQSAVDASAHGDTVLVYPGRYLGNVDYNGKNITIASLELTTGNPAYRDSTIIDGNHSGSCIKSLLDVNGARIYGFKITNGSGSPLAYYQGVQVALGGGIVVYNALAFDIVNCIVEDNLAYWGGGIYVYNGTIHILGTDVRDNFATSGGGVLIDYYGQAIFDQVNRCNVYNNTSGNGQDILATDTRLETSVYLDMGTVYPTNNYYVSYIKSVPDWPGGFPVVDIQRGYRTEINHDLYVSPVGDDVNDGLSPAAPLKSICKALQTVVSDSLIPKTVYLASGVYSTSEGQFFPVSMKPYVKLYGCIDTPPVLENLNTRETITASRADNASIENIVIYYGNNYQGAVGITATLSDGFKFKNIHILPHQSNTWKGIVLASNTYYPANCEIEDIYITGQTSEKYSGLMLNSVDAFIKGLTIEGCHNTGDEFDSPMSLFYFHGNKLTLENSRIINNTMAYEDTPVVSIGAAHFNSDSRLIMNNVLIANNQSGGYTPVFIASFTDSTSVVSNCTFANNGGSSIANIMNGNLRVANCIFDNGAPVEVLCQGTYPNTVSHVSFENNFIRGYPDSFATSAVNHITFNDVVLTGDPGFCSSVVSDPLSYRLGNSSICREAGTPDTTGLFLPELDLYGNLRMYGAAIDIGCNEWNYPVSLQDDYLPQPELLSAYPNPFKQFTTLRINLDALRTGNPGKVNEINVGIYNLRGQKVKTIALNPAARGEQITYWDGRDDNNNTCSNGIYVLSLSVNGRIVNSRKVTIVK